MNLFAFRCSAERGFCFTRKTVGFFANFKRQNLAILGVVLNATRMRKFVVKVISRIIYIALGWSIICFYPILVASLGLSSVWLLIGGGIAYTVGSILYGIGSKKKYWHSIFHIFCLVGTLLQFLSVLLYPVIGL